MAKALEDNWAGPLEGIAIAPHGYAHVLKRLRAHPWRATRLPDETSLAAAE